jgi:hypothetical protein
LVPLPSSHLTECSTFINHRIIRRCIASILAAPANNQLRIFCMYKCTINMLPVTSCGTEHVITDLNYYVTSVYIDKSQRSFVFRRDKKRNSVSVSELYRLSHCRMSAKLVPNFADRGCRVVSASDQHGR